MDGTFSRGFLERRALSVPEQSTARDPGMAEDIASSSAPLSSGRERITAYPPSHEMTFAERTLDAADAARPRSVPAGTSKAVYLLRPLFDLTVITPAPTPTADITFVGFKRGLTARIYAVNSVPRPPGFNGGANITNSGFVLFPSWMVDFLNESV